MHNKSNVLRGFDNLLTQDTVFVFFIVMLFLFMADYLHKRIRILVKNQLIGSFLAALLAITGLFFIYILVHLLIRIVARYRFGSNEPFSFSITVLVLPIVLTLGCSIIYSLHDWVRRSFRAKIKSVVKSLFLESAFVLIATTGAMHTSQIVFSLINDSGSPKISRTLAIFLPAFVALSIAFFVYNYWSYLNSLKIQQKELQIARLQQQVTKTQLDVLSSKINPHFLYNALNAIAGLAMEDGLKTREMAIALSKLFQYNINKRESSLATVREEMEMVSYYLAIEKIRFEERLQYTSSVQAGIEDELLPMNLIQPLVENAIKHGHKDEGVDVIVTVKKIGDELIVSVQDRGKPFDTTLSPGYGLKSLYDKLDILAPGQYEIAFLNDPKEIRVTIGQLKTKD